MLLGRQVQASTVLFSRETFRDPSFCTQRILNRRRSEPTPLTATRERCLPFLARHSQRGTRPRCLQQRQARNTEPCDLLDPGGKWRCDLRLDKFSSAGGSVFVGTLFVCLAASAAFAASNETVLHSFRPAQMDTAPGLVVDARGNLYGSAGFGGVGCGTATDGCGVIFKLIAQGGQWHYQVLYSFQGGSDGSGPNAEMLDAAGNIYGTTYWGGDLSCGTAFRLAPNGRGGWAFCPIHEFKGSPNGCHPVGRFVLDSAGNLYGVTGNGGILFGTVFQRSPSAAGWHDTLLYSFPSAPHYHDGRL